MNAIDLFLKKMHSMLQGGGSVRISALVEEHLAMQPVLHPHATSKQLDMGALAYCAARLPVEAFAAEEIFFGISDGAFERQGLKVDAPVWKPVQSATARHRRRLYNAKTRQLAVYIGSMSDVEDSMTILVAFYIEAQKMRLLCENVDKLQDCVSPGAFADLSRMLGPRLQAFEAYLSNPIDFKVAMLEGAYVDFSRGAQRWWVDVAKACAEFDLDLRHSPVYFVSSNTHSCINLLSGFDRMHAEEALDSEIVTKKRAEAKDANVSRETLSYVLGRMAEEESRSYIRLRHAREKSFGLHRLEPKHSLQVDAQVFEISRFARNAEMDSRIHIPLRVRQALRKSDALILNISYPLGWSAYSILREVSENVGELRGIYIMGKAASLNASVGDVVCPIFAQDAVTGNALHFRNDLDPEDLRPLMGNGSILGEQKALTVRGTFLQNQRLLLKGIEEGFSVVEMELGPYLNRVYELLNPDRYPLGGNAVLHPSFRLGAGYYISDTPHKPGKTLGQRLGVESAAGTYALSIAILNDLLGIESKRL